MSQYCHHHPLEPARWLDPRQGLAWCRRCVDIDPQDSRHARSKLGQADLERLRDPSGEAPFWDQLTASLVLPFQPLLLVSMLLVTGVLSAIALALPSGGWFAAAASGCLTAPLASLLMQAKVANLRELSPSVRVLSTMAPRTLVDVAATVSATALVAFALVQFCPERWSGAAFLTQAVVVPGFLLAAVLGLTSQGSPLRACGEVMKTVGPAWSLVVVFAVLLMALEGLVVALFYGELPDAWSVPVIIASFLYGGLVLCGTLGAVRRQYAQRFEAESPVVAARASRPGRDTLYEAVEGWARQGDLFEVERSLWKALRQRPGHMGWQDEMSRLLESRHDRAGQQAWLDQYLREILRTGDKARLMLLYNSRLRGSQAIKPSVPELRVDLARALRAQGNPEEATGWLLNLHHEFPAWPGVADAYALLIQILCDDLGRPELARPSAQYLLDRHPQYRDRAKIEAFLRGPQ
jgi:hypothetical protein